MRTDLEQDVGNNVEDLSDELKELVIWEVLQGKFALSSVTRIGLAEDCVAISRDNVSTVEGFPDVFADSLVRSILADLGLHLAKPDEDFLISKAVKRAGKTIQSSGVGKERV